jgi:hypothetical protein
VDGRFNSINSIEAVLREGHLLISVNRA